jgi:hypothetical protein
MRARALVSDFALCPERDYRTGGFARTSDEHYVYCSSLAIYYCTIKDASVVNVIAPYHRTITAFAVNPHNAHEVRLTLLSFSSFAHGCDGPRPAQLIGMAVCSTAAGNIGEHGQNDVDLEPRHVCAASVARVDKEQHPVEAHRRIELGVPPVHNRVVASQRKRHHRLRLRTSNTHTLNC